MKKKDLILGAGIIVIALAMLLVMRLTRGEEGNQIRVTLDGKIYGTYSLSKDQTIEVKDGDFYNRIRIEDGKAYMEEANCPDGYCEEQGKISGHTQTIVCVCPLIFPCSSQYPSGQFASSIYAFPSSIRIRL